MSLWERLIGGGHHGGRDHHGAYRRDMRNPAPPPAPAGVACPSCRAVSPVGARFCQTCGQSLALQACTRCGAALVADSRFCAQCGATANRPGF